MSRTRTGARSLRRAPLVGALAILLAVLASGAPAFASSVIDARDDCHGDCDGDLGDFGCPPTCHSGACGRGTLSLMPTPARPPEAGDDARAALKDEIGRPSSGATLDIFHPPKS